LANKILAAESENGLICSNPTDVAFRFGHVLMAKPGRAEQINRETWE
jgi:hypothetical protein